MGKDYEPAVFEKKWQERWQESGIWKADAQTGKPKFFLMFAYPGTSGFLHVGHMRGYTYSDVITRYKRMTGYNVLFPVGTHASGNLCQTFARKVERNDQSTIELLTESGASSEEIEKLKEPAYVAEFLSQVYINEYWKKFGFLADWDRFITTIDTGYKKFIQWQFRKLHARGMLTQKPYYGTACMECGPVAVDASETDISQGGNAEKQEWILLKFKMDDEFLMAATLRPETVFGQTNFWANPDVEYVKARVNGEVWIISPQCAEKLSFQKNSVEIIGKIGGKNLIGRTVMAPVIDREIPVLPSRFTDPDFGTGLVTSVPSDAPYDWIALQDLTNDPETCRKFGLDPEMVRNIEPIPIIESKGWGPNPAAEICRKMGITDQNDPKLEEATKEIYKAGFHTGRMRENCGQFAGKPVATAKDEVKAMMLEMGVADVMYDLSEPVICRCGAKVIMKLIPDQWFIDYGHPEVTEIAKAHVPKMNIQPQTYKDNLPGALDWFKERACVRMGNWLGTPFPFDERWTIEPISDSTLYSAYYIVSGAVNQGILDPEKLNDAFFDHIFLGNGSPDEVSKVTGINAKVIAGLRKDFKYWYPLNINLGGKEHQTVHFPVFLLNHAAILPDNMPKGLFVHWWISGKAGKMSKSKGGAEPIPDAASTYTVDGLRLYYCHISSPHVDVEWDPASVYNSRKSVERAWYFAGELLEMQGGGEKPIDAWLESQFHINVHKASSMMDDIKLREAANIIYFDIVNDLKWYLRRGGNNSELLRKAINAWIRMMAPFTPHMAEELWEMAENADMVSASRYPDTSEFNIDEKALEIEEYLESVLADISGILKMTGMIPKRICLYTAYQWKYEVQRMMAQEGKDMGAVMKHAQLVPELKSKSKEISAFASRLMKDMKRFGDGGIPVNEQNEELEALRAAIDLFGKEFSCEVSVFSGDEPDLYDPSNKRNVASPGKPGIHVE
ncbi:MAG: leucine--tRNA ligase [Candidatus Thermoplasmatota archaeon]|nr:leucine--tRNA ligase [Candidatus Thermoplasmatota archaeon]MBU4145164.1 leucine--tRNA ligase [Candidatus Thermoplasmatota archaeon]MBU4591536.1 leucine--tRNA ligase [Candidatus Thermoplasmatota archaeon]